jgi:O-antigen ligase
LIYWVAAFTSALEIVLSYYRSAIFMLAVIILVSILIQKIRYRWLLLLIVIISAVLFTPSTVADRVIYTFQSNSASNSVIGINTTERYDYHWPRTWEQAIKYFPIGVGFKQLPIARGDVHGAYNQYLDWFAEFGIIGFGIAIWMILNLIRYLWSLVRGGKDDFDLVCSVGILSSFLGILFRNLTGDAFIYSWLSLFLLLLGVMVAVNLKERQKMLLIPIGS